ncbi:MAG TPA: hypothetical protein VFL82_15090 [Thermomicrobiales bacterium]|nr:hypothetical protein [Thermomicrobiales bacterium]
MSPQMDPIAQEYLSLAFGIERLFPGYVDAYFGPPEIKESALAGDLPNAEQLLDRAQILGQEVEAASFNAQREQYLTVQVRAMIALCGQLTGETAPYQDEVRDFFDIEAAHTPESLFDEANTTLDELLPGEGDVRERMMVWRQGYEIQPEVAATMIDLIAGETRRRTATFVDLPPDEQVEFTFVQNKPWSGYNWYLGHDRSRVEINTDNPIHLNALPGLIAHEAYPGHHTEHSLKERRLYRERGYGENAIQLINTPECVISEGIATLAESIIFTPEELATWLAESVYPAAGIVGDPIRDAAIHQAQRALRAVGANAALLLYEHRTSEAEVVAYLMRYGLRSEQEARHSLSFISNPLWRSYIFTYHAGRDLLGQWLDQGDADQRERQSRFRTLLTEQVTPSHVRKWIATETAA